MTSLEQQQADEIAALRARVAEAENARDLHLQWYQQAERDKERMETMFVDLLVRLCQQD